MKVGITGGTGFMGSHLARQLLENDHQVLLLSRNPSGRNPELKDRSSVDFVAGSVTEKQALVEAFDGCEAIAHLAGINLERGAQTYNAVHIHGTRNVVDASDEVGVSKIILSSFLRARPACGSAYHESKWEAEEIIRRSGLDYTVFKPGITYGTGDHMLEHISRSLVTVPVFGSIGFTDRWLRPLAIDDLVDIMVVSLTEDRLSEMTVGMVGPEELSLDDTVRRIGRVIDRKPVIVPLPVPFHYGLSWVQEQIMETPIISMAQVRILEASFHRRQRRSVTHYPPISNQLDRSRTSKSGLACPKSDRSALAISACDPN